MTGTLVAHGYSLADAQQAALGLVNQVLTEQVSAKGFDDTFGLLLIVSLMMIPTLLLLRAPKPGAAAVSMH